MSTRGVIARAQGDGWVGVYQHFDSYPTGLGVRLWASVRDDFAGDVGRFLAYAVDAHRGGWSSYVGPLEHRAVEGCYAHSRDGERESEMVYEERGECSEATCCPLFIEWAYVFDSESRTMAVLASRRAESGQYLEPVGLRQATDCARHRFGKFGEPPEDVGQPCTCRQVSVGGYHLRHEVVAVVAVDGAEPDWAGVEARRRSEAA